MEPPSACRGGERPTARGVGNEAGLATLVHRASPRGARTPRHRTTAHSWLCCAAAPQVCDGPPRQRLAPGPALLLCPELGLGLELELLVDGDELCPPGAILTSSGGGPIASTISFVHPETTIRHAAVIAPTASGRRKGIRFFIDALHGSYGGGSK